MAENGADALRASIKLWPGWADLAAERSVAVVANVLGVDSCCVRIGRCASWMWAPTSGRISSSSYRWTPTAKSQWYEQIAHQVCISSSWPFIPLCAQFEPSPGNLPELESNIAGHVGTNVELIKVRFNLFVADPLSLSRVAALTCALLCA